MASRDSFEEDLLCPVCCEVFINPVVLSCSHSICEDCVRRFWESKTLRECPVCRRRSSNDHPPVNLALRNLCETYRKRLGRNSSSNGGNICSLHNEKLKVFCLDDQEPVCLVCRDSRKHTNHRFCPVEEAALDKKEILKEALQVLEGHRIDFALGLFDYDTFAKSNAEEVENKIKEEFEELHKFLRDEEAARVTALREEEQQKNQKLEEMSRRISSLSCMITDVEEQMNADDVSFLQNFKATLESALYVPSPPDPRPTVIPNLSNHLINLKLKVFQKMQENVGPTSCFNISPSHVQSDLAAMAISDHPEEYNKPEQFQRDGANLFGDLQQFKPKAPPVGATNVFPTVFSTEPTNNLPMIHRRLSLSPISQSLVTTRVNFGHTSVVDQPPVKLVFRWRGHGSEDPPSEILSRVRRCGVLREFSESS